MSTTEPETRPLWKNKYFLTGVILIGFLCLYYGIRYYILNKPTERQENRIAAILPLTGPLAFFGEPERDVLLMSVDEVNQQGGIKGMPVKLTIEDSKASARDGVSALQKVLLDKPMAVITSLTTISNATQPILTDQKMPQIALSVHPTLARQSQYTLRPYYGFEDEMIVLADYMAKKGYKKIGVLWVMVPECESAVNEVLAPQLQARGGSLVASESYNFGEPNIRPQLVKIVGQKPDAILVLDFGNLMGVILKEAQNLGARDKIIGNIGLLSAPPIDPDLLEGIAFAGPSFIINNSQVYQDFARRFEERTKTKPSYDTLYTRDAFMLLVQVLGARQNETPQALLEALHSVKEFNGVTGRMLVQPDGNVKVEIGMGLYRHGQITPLGN